MKKEEFDSEDSTPPLRPPLQEMEEGDQLLWVDNVYWSKYHERHVAKVKIKTLNGKIFKRINLARFRGTKADPWLKFMAKL